MSYPSRIASLQKSLSTLEVDAVLIQNPTDIYYLCGAQVSRGSLFIAEKSARLLVDARYFEECQQLAHVDSLLSGQQELLDLERAGALQKIHRLGFDADQTPYARVEQWRVCLEDGGPKLCPLKHPVMPLRCYKDAEEQARLRAAALLGVEGFHFVLSQLKEGITEAELARDLEIFWLQRGGSGLAFDPIIAFGENSSMPHYTPQDTPLQAGVPVLMDMGVALDRYNSDMTRTCFFGPASESMRAVYHAVLEAQEAALNLCRPGVTIAELDAHARQVLERHGYLDYFTHSLGHGIGLEVHESPVLRSQGPGAETELAPGMAITIEPGLYLPGIGGVRIEDTVLITAEGHENLTPVSKELLELPLN
jgi:Xaa-Pro aminopeptidase